MTSETSYTDFVGEVQHRIEAGRQAEAVRTTRAVLETLGERVEEGAATDVASPLPMEIDRYLLAADHGQQFDFDEFVTRVRERLNYEDLDLETGYGRPSGIDESDAVFRAKAVVALLAERVPGGEIGNIEAQLPDEYGELFELVDAETTPWEQRQG
ncbi:DUF2267 domain-containing protein [Halopiger xanaduensis]|uniref:DUF2267 domain-containing protein n=1 Tax=Halopiger xanaduensis (strain DSM 18323 / JCM 14033 / SH-6) TaxID=797210 RepID=F8D5R7_HALXS|nr:DUF2267 domain-containing protein [Halopiger xanaduensis]AEH36489.1 Protein of unknown function DUF2267 [Halopiger xanaduensis SH-6]